MFGNSLRYQYGNHIVHNKVRESCIVPKSPLRKILITVNMYYKLETMVCNKYSCNSTVSVSYRLCTNFISRLWM
jgi:hypothetical protein